MYIVKLFEINNADKPLLGVDQIRFGFVSAHASLLDLDLVRSETVFLELQVII
jgi:hypothetical protein